MINPAFSYIQLHPDGKIPTREWKGDGRAMLADVREWVEQGYNLGVRTDRTTGAWVLDVDVDPATGQVHEAWNTLLEENGGLPATYSVRTPSGGLHYYFRFPDGTDVRNDQGKVISEGVDIRGIGGYVVAPGMRASYEKHGIQYSGEYVVIDDSPIAQTPDWIAERFKAREQEKAAKAERVNTGVVMPKAEVIEDQWDQMARGELNGLFAKVEALAALPEGQSMEILGEQRGWERGAGFFTLACKIIEVARWPHTSVTTEQAHLQWAKRVPAKYAHHDWNNALENAGPTWAWGEQQRNPIDIFEGVRSQGGAQAPGEAGAEPKVFEPLDISGQPVGFLSTSLFRKKKDDAEGEATGGFMVEAARAAVDRVGPIAVDPVGSLWTYDRGVYVLADDIVRDRLYHMLGDKFTSGYLTNVRLAVQARAPKLDLTQPPHPGTMNFTNGTLDWRNSDEVVPHDPSVLETTQFPYDWDASAGCPKFDNWLETMLEPDQVDLAWKILGYMMLSGNPLQVAFMLYGKGSNGKSTFAHVIERLVGMANTSAVALKDFNARFSTASMIGKIANVVGDIDSDYQMSTAALKQVTGADAMQFERKNRDSFRATLWATCLFSANRIPGTNDGSEGYAERWVPLHFKRKASEHRIEGFSEEGLWAEIPGIAAKAVRTLRSLPIHKGSSRNAAFDLTSESAKEAVEEFREASNSYYAWIKNNTAPSADVIMKPKDLWAAYKTSTGSRHGGTNCPREFLEVLVEFYGPAKPRRGLHMGVQNVVHSLPVDLVDPDETAIALDIFDGVPTRETASH